MATLKIENIDEGVVARLRAMATQHHRTPEDEAADILVRALSVRAQRGNWAARAKEIASISPASVGTPDAVEILREDRLR